MEIKSSLDENTLKYNNEILQNYEKLSESFSNILKDKESLERIKKGIDEQYSMPVPFPIGVYEFLSDEISFSDFPNLDFYENYKDYSTQEYIEVLRTDFEEWNILLSKLPTCQSDIEIGLNIMDDFIEEHKNSIWRSQFLMTRNSYVNYPIDGKMKKLEDSRFYLEGFIEDEEDDLKRQILSSYLTKINKIIYPEYIELPLQNQQTINLINEQCKKVIDEPLLYKYNRFNPNYMHEYLSEVKARFEFIKKNEFGAVCLALLEKKIFSPTIKFNSLVDKLAKYWNVEPLKDKHPNKYKSKKAELIRMNSIFDKQLI